MEKNMTSPEIEDLEIDLLLEAVYRYYNFDFRGFSSTHIKRRVRYHLEENHYVHIPELIHDILTNDVAFQTLLKNFSINVSDMFRDPGFYKSLIEQVFPVLHTYPFLKIWHAGCASGEEVYSMEILLSEHDLLDKTQLYATDFNNAILDVARDGIFPISKAAGFDKNYKEAGGKRSLSDYYRAAYNFIQIHRNFRDRILFARHNLANEGSFAEVNMIVCRNVFIYFQQKLQEKVLQLFYDSLVPGGFLCLGLRESLNGLKQESYFELIDRANRIYRKKYTNS